PTTRGLSAGVLSRRLRACVTFMCGDLSKRASVGDFTPKTLTLTLSLSREGGTSRRDESGLAQNRDCSRSIHCAMKPGPYNSRREPLPTRQLGRSAAQRRRVAARKAQWRLLRRQRDRG